MKLRRLRVSIPIIVAAALLAGAIAPVLTWAEPAICSQHSVSPAHFSPNGDRVKDVARIRFVIGQTARVRVVVVNSAGTQVRLLTDARRTPRTAPYSVLFNGRDAAGKPLPDGRYVYRMVNSNANGVQTESGSVVIDRRAPVLRGLAAVPSVFWPNGDGFRDRTLARYRLSEYSRVGLAVTTRGGATVRPTGWAWQGPGSRYKAWDGRDRWGRTKPYGGYRMTVTAMDRAGNRVRKVLGVMISPFSDIGAQPSTFRSAVLSLVRRRVLAPSPGSWFAGRANGTFGSYARVRRGDLAVAVVRARGWQNESPGDVTFSDLPRTASLYKYAAIAVRHGVMGYYDRQAKTFGASQLQSASSVMTAIVRALGLSRLAANIRAQDPRTPSYAGYSVIASDLHLRYRYTGIFPRSAYTRRELAFSIAEMMNVPSWRVDAMKGMFGSVAARRIVQSRRQYAVTNAGRQLIGYPYVWGGESFSEGGFDCSGLTYYVYRTLLGYRIARTSYDAAADSRYPRITMSNLKPADTIYFYTASRSRIGHTGIYLGNRYFIHSTRSRAGVSIDRFDRRYDSYWMDTFAWGRRIIPVVRLTGVKVYPSTITLSSAGAHSTRISYRISKRSKVVVKVVRGGTTVRVLVNGWRAAGGRSVIWNGRDSADKPVAVGRYAVRTTVRDEEGNTRSATRTVTVAK